MAPIPTTPLKRATPSDDAEELWERKRSRTTLDSSQIEEPSFAGVTVDLFEETPRQLLMRSVALALEHVGFEGATAEALEAVCSEADTYVSELLAEITTSMLSARRSHPTPLDFQYGLSQFALSTSSLEPHLKPPIRAEQLRIQLEPPSPSDNMPRSLDRLFGEELSGESDKALKPYIPKHLPPFPSKHTYKFTETESSRETDPKKIREEASLQARQGEEALRRLTTVGKIGKEKVVKMKAEKDPKSKQRYQLWEQTMADSSTPYSSGGTLGSASTAHSEKEVERAVVVNASSAYHRKGVGKRKGVPQLPVELLGHS